MYILFLVLTLAYFAMISVLDARKIKSLRHVDITEDVRCKWYWFMMTGEWAAVIPLGVMCLYARISAADIGLGPILINDNVWFAVIVLVLCGGIFLAYIVQIIIWCVNAKFRKSIQEKVTAIGNKSPLDIILAKLMVPVSKREKVLLFWVSLTSGIFEEVLCRGFLYFLFPAILPGLSIIAVVLITSVIFGLIHCYQGVSGMIKSSVLGVVMGCLYIASGSIIPGIIFHFVNNFANAFLLSEE